VPQKSFLPPLVAARLSLCFSVFSDEMGRKSAGTFAFFALARPDAKVVDPSLGAKGER
jgi:hypothetical protein